jgi:crossover junction endodeoxyribonuclease RusA
VGDIVLSWPPKELNPNSSAKLRAKLRAKKAHREEAYYATKAALGAGYRAPVDQELAIIVTFYPPDNRRRDEDNCIGSLKRAQDGIAQAIGLDDYYLRPRYQFAEPVKGGKVVISIGDGA